MDHFGDKRMPFTPVPFLCEQRIYPRNDLLLIHRNALLDIPRQQVYIHVSMKCFSTAQAAKMLGFQRTYLQALIRERKIKAPKLQRFGGVSVRLWTARDVENARKALNRDK